MMGFRVISSVFCLVSVLSLTASHPTGLANNDPSHNKFQRLVSITVSQNGKPILKGLTSDDGSPDADEVWYYLKRVGLQPTDDFPDLDRPKDGGSAEITGDIHLNIQYGGRVDLKRIELTYQPNAARNRVWKVDSSIVESQFERRLISRRMAAQLRDQRIPD